MERRIQPTADGSVTIAIPDAGITFHSLHGAIQESTHIFIEAAYRHLLATAAPAGPVCILEMGFGTGLNALLTLLEADSGRQQVEYSTVEAFPLEPAFLPQLNYCIQLQQAAYQPLFEQLHTGAWEQPVPVSPYFRFTKYQQTLEAFCRQAIAAAPAVDQPDADHRFHLVYFDAFAPISQPELWTEDSFRQLFLLMRPGGLLTTYCSKSIVRKAMQAAGFTIEKIPGPWGKREMVRASVPV
ncbi:MAG: tRNA (5-methylaminomethyl-2-thiouridine)(34)-methyltransferase MnmD [Candidatus Pseudobacter hemicellulosilyticus]|uniref:tRNA (5-methylaminomethyl-2-thiouridine)(34)-methyltransferase MnmD n=1 Tax=Candidatus Pseudobacter hemicellulosilyticus TaxID=3121375 RepID=A0AAJ5WZ95_9BACT|nr:MAG: tRNA (5-methylaminomethyl-2-thiouridine)(34)-methyltransferase MnmD [Pseudobacter sp.]